MTPEGSIRLMKLARGALLCSEAELSERKVDGHVIGAPMEGVPGTRPVLIAVAAVTARQFLFTYAPFMESFFDTRPLSLQEGLQIIAVGVVLLLVLDAEKRIRRWLLNSERRGAAHG